MSLTISLEILNGAKALAAAGKVAEAWQLLADAGDSYADNAASIINEFGDPQSIFAKIVDVQWDRTVGADIKNEKFFAVAQTHLDNYLNLIEEPLYQLPDTEQIEASYRNALERNGVPAITAIDSLFSLLDLQLESGSVPFTPDSLKDVSWGTIMNMEPARIRYDSTVFADLQVQPLSEIIAVAFEVFDLYGWSSFVGMVDLTVDLGFSIDGVSQLLGGEPQDVVTSIHLLNAIDGSADNSTLESIYESLTRFENNNSEQVINDVQQAIFGTDYIGDLSNREALVTAAAALSQTISSNPELQFTLVSLNEISAENLAQLAAQDTTDGRNYRYSLVNGLSFALEGNNLSGASNSNYDLSNFSEQYLADRSHYLQAILSRNATDSQYVIDGNNTLESYDDLGSGTRSATADLSNVFGTSRPDIATQYVFGGTDSETFSGGLKGDHLYGGGGNDTIDGQGGDDYLEGNQGDDTLRGGGDNDT